MMMLVWDAYKFSGILPKMVTTNQAFQAGSNDRDVKMFSQYFLEMMLVRNFDNADKGIVLFRQPSHCHPQDLLAACCHCEDQSIP